MTEHFVISVILFSRNHFTRSLTSVLLAAAFTVIQFLLNIDVLNNRTGFLVSASTV